MNRPLHFFIEQYLQSRPLFFSLIRSQEAYLFNTYEKYLQAPILDFGCGDGFFAELTFGKRSIDIGLDVQDSRMKEAEKKDVYKKIIEYDGNTIPLPNQSMRTVVSNCVLEHIPDLKLSLREIARVLQPGGMFITTVMTNRWEDYFIGTKILGKKYKDYMRKKQVHFNLLSLDQWNTSFKNAGLTPVETVGYLSPRNARYMDLSHYFSVPSLITYHLFKKWVVWPQWYKLFALDKKLLSLIDIPTPPEQSAALFYVLKKE